MKLREMTVFFKDGSTEKFECEVIQIVDWVQVQGAEGMKWFANPAPNLKMKLLDKTDVVIPMSGISKLSVREYEAKVTGVPVMPDKMPPIPKKH